MSGLASHQNRLHLVTPDMAYVTKYTEKLEDRGNHWFWREGRRNHHHNDRGQATLTWRVKPSWRSGFKTHGTFTVARLWIEHMHGPIPKGTRIESICGLSQCINPDHWRCIVRPFPMRVQVLEQGGWRVVRSRDGEEVPAGRTHVFHALHEGLVHLLEVTPLLQTLFVRPPYAVCGLEMVPALVVLVDAQVTCMRCA